MPFLRHMFFAEIVLMRQVDQDSGGSEDFE